jgi:simple sugar transport system substrate-binding protein
MSYRRRSFWGAAALSAVLVLVAAACSSNNSSSGGTPTSGNGGGSSSAKPFVFGMLLVGPYNDHGWSQANYEGGKYVEQKTGAKMVYLDKVNSADRPSVKAEDVISNMIEKQGAKLIFATSDDFKDAIFAAAAAHPDIPMIWSSGDSAWQQGQDYQANLTNLGNYFVKMEYTQEIAGCAAALTTQTGKIGVVGPLINDETRRFVNAAYLGAKYCWENYRKETTPLGFSVKWIGFWFNIPGTTLDPTQVTNDLINSGDDVVMDHLDTTEALTRTEQLSKAGKKVWAIGYDYKSSCSVAPSICLGIPYFNWGPGYLKIVQSAMDNAFKAQFTWDGPDWSNINDTDTSAVGFENGPALSSENATTLDEFIKGLGDGSIVLFKGPLNWQDGSTYLTDGQTADDTQIWYSPQLLQGIEGASS